MDRKVKQKWGTRTRSSEEIAVQTPANGDKVNTPQCQIEGRRLSLTNLTRSEWKNINSEPTGWFTHCHCPDEQFIEATAAFVYAPAPLPDIAEKGKAAQRALCAWKQEQRGWVISLDKRHAHLFLARSLVWTCQRLSQRSRPGLDLKFLTCDCVPAQAGRYFVHRRALQCANSSPFVKEYTPHFILRDYCA